MKMGVSEAARILEIDRSLVKEMAFHFRNYLSDTANPPKGVPRQFTLLDLQVLAYVYSHWEDDPDFKNIEVGLNLHEHQEDPYNDLLTSVTPIFQEPPEELDETWIHGSLVSGIVYSSFNTYTLAESYKLACDTLVEAALSNFEAHELIYPIIYNYRHATELYLKGILSPKEKKHDLQKLLQQFRDYLRQEYVTEIPTWFENIVLAFADFDPDSTTFRYADEYVFSRRTGSGGEFWVDLFHVKKLMGWLAESFQRIRNRQR